MDESSFNNFSNIDINNDFVNLCKKMGDLLDSSKSQKLLIKKNLDNKSYTIEHKTYSIWERILYYLGINHDQDDKTTLCHLKQIIGDKRFTRILLKEELGLQSLINAKTMVLTKNIIHKIFIGLADVRIEDVEEHLTLNSCQRIHDLSYIQDLDCIHNKLFPYNEIKTIFDKHCQKVSLQDKASTSGKGFIGLQERVSVLLKAKETFCELSDNYFENDLKAVITAEMLTSRLADREPPEGTLVRLKDDYFVVKKIFAKGGAYATLLSKIGSGKAQTLLVCRGTAARWNATTGILSVINNLTEEIGFYGISKIWPDVKEYLAKEHIERIQLFGKGLGGAHVQYLATLLTGTTHTKANKLTTVASVGTPEAVHSAYTEICYKKAIHPIWKIFRNTVENQEINTQENEIDYTPLVGGAHLYHDLDYLNILYMTPGMLDECNNKLPQSPLFDEENPYNNNEITELEGEEFRAISLLASEDDNSEVLYDFTPYSIPKPTGTFDAIKKLFLSLSHGHIRQNTLYPEFKIHSIDEYDLLGELAKGNECEYLREIAATIFNIITLGYFNRISFKDFYEKERQSFDEKNIIIIERK